MTNFKYKKQARELERFDAYCHYNGYGGIRLTKPMLDGFIYGEFERSSTHYTKEILMRDFAEFLGRHGYQVYVPLTKSAPQKKNAHIPYIFTQKQLYKLFMEVDSYPLEETNNRAGGLCVRSARRQTMSRVCGTARRYHPTVKGRSEA